MRSQRFGNSMVPNGGRYYNITIRLEMLVEASGVHSISPFSNESRGWLRAGRNEVCNGDEVELFCSDMHRHGSVFGPVRRGPTCDVRRSEKMLLSVCHVPRGTWHFPFY